MYGRNKHVLLLNLFFNRAYILNFEHNKRNYWLEIDLFWPFSNNTDLYRYDDF